MSLRKSIFAVTYDRMSRKAEEAGLSDLRQGLLADVAGRILEIGGGTGANLPFYDGKIESLVVTEPEPPMLRRLQRKARELAPLATVLRAPAEDLPFEDDSFDTAVATLVLCTVPDPASSLRELARVLKPGGRLFFIEHVRAQDPGLAKWQDRLHPLWLRFGHGCNCNRPTLDTIEASPLRVEEFRRGRIPKSPPIVRPLVTGVAVAL